MINDPLLSSNAAERLAALRKPAATRRKPAHASKIVTAGISTTALLGLVAAMGWQTASTNAQSVPATDPGTQTDAAAVLTPATPDSTPLPPATLSPVTVAPLTAAPVTVPVAAPPTDAPLPVVEVTPVVPVAVPAPQPSTKAKQKKQAPVATTQASG